MRGIKPKRANVVPIRASVLPKPPTWLTAGARREWERCTADLNRRGLLFDGALASLATYCAMVDQVELLGRIVAKEGPLADDGKAHRAMLAAAIQSRLLAAELGLSVVSRTRSFQGKSTDEQAWDALEVD